MGQEHNWWRAAPEGDAAADAAAVDDAAIAKAADDADAVEALGLWNVIKIM